MLGIGWTEMLVIGVVALIVIGPKELPAVMKRIGQFAGTIRRMGSDFQRELNKTTGLNEITNLRNSVTQPLKATAEAIRKEFNTTTAAGKVEPSGALKPADPKVESVVDEIKAKAGMAPEKPAPLPFTAAAAAAMAAKSEQAAAAPAPATPVKAKRAPRVKLPADKPVETAELPAAKAKTATAKTAAAKPATNPVATKPAVAKPAVAKSTATKPATSAKPKAAKPAATEPTAPAATAKAPAAKPARAKKTASAAPVSASAEPAPKPAPRARKPATKKA